MKTEITIYVPNPRLSKAVQALAIEAGYSWRNETGIQETGIQFTEQEFLFLQAPLKRIFYTSNPDAVHDYDASTELSKIVEWLEESGKESEVEQLRKDNERLARENQQLIDDLRQAEEKFTAYGRGCAALERACDNLSKQSSFPKGYDWHNPDNLTPEQVGVSDGWRLLLKSEIDPNRPLTEEIECYRFGDWDKTWGGNQSELTYRTKWPLPNTAFQACEAGCKADNQQAVATPQDDFPGSTGVVLDEKKRIGMEWFVKYLEACREVHFMARLTACTTRYCMQYGKCSFEKLSIDGDNLILNGHIVTPTEIRP